MREEEKKRTSLQRFFRKRWVFPAIYLLSAAVVLTAVLWYQASSNDVKDQITDNGNETSESNTNDALEVSKQVENVKMPVSTPESVSVITKFYEADATQKDKEAALVNYKNQYSLSKGIDLAEKDGKEFEISASLSGTVAKASKDPVLGHVVEVDHEDGLSTVYQSLAAVSVAEGDKIEQGQVIGTSGKNLYNEEAGNHVHFEIRKDGVALNPEEFFNKPVTSIKQASTEQASEEAKEKQPAEEPAPSEEPAKEDTEEKGKADEKGTEDKSGSKDSSQVEEGSSES
ncbi:peptidoglycan DD-metalloendopeptidase family protein [Bacillus gobiensis]|uniref:peptidoglycan DD-metalloendopeptidase family protein n=1 Tax=Bacillus gobiensis TaxID=1441095 RepID=UPI003D257AA0